MKLPASQLVKMQERKTLEFKRDLSSPNNILKTLVAFANSAGGCLLIGVEDKSREVLGVLRVLSKIWGINMSIVDCYLIFTQNYAKCDY